MGPQFWSNAKLSCLRVHPLESVPEYVPLSNYMGLTGYGHPTMKLGTPKSWPWELRFFTVVRPYQLLFSEGCGFAFSVRHFLGAQILNPLGFQLTVCHQTCKIPWQFDNFPSRWPIFWGFPSHASGAAAALPPVRPGRLQGAEVMVRWCWKWSWMLKLKKRKLRRLDLDRV